MTLKKQSIRGLENIKLNGEPTTKEELISLSEHWSENEEITVRKILKHSLGLCGEHFHPNIFTFLLGGLGLSPAFNYIYFKLKSYDKNKS